MKFKLFIAVCLLFTVLQSCRHCPDCKTTLSSEDSAAVYKGYLFKLAHRPASKLLQGVPETTAHFTMAMKGDFVIDRQGTMITVDQANAQLNSFNAMHTGDDDVKSYYFSANVINDIFAQSGGADNVAFIKVMFAHSANYVARMSDLAQGAVAPPEEFSMIVVGIDAQGNYLFVKDPNNPGKPCAYDHVAPCPTLCGDGNMTRQTLVNQ